jgi:DNA-binding response OmpR family regulator
MGEKNKIKILLVDDEEEFVNALSERMKMRKLDSEIAYDGEQALQLVDNQIPDVIVLDLKMPGIDGFEVLKSVKTNYPEVEVIILTGHDSEKDKIETQKMGAFDYLQKPIEVNTLVKKIRSAYRTKIEKSLMAATFAEAGEFTEARKILK